MSAYVALTAEDAAILQRMPAMRTARQWMAESNDWVVMLVETRPRKYALPSDTAMRATHGLDDATRTAIAHWMRAHREAQCAAAELARAEEALA